MRPSCEFSKQDIAMIMSFDLHPYFRTIVCFLYWVKDSDKRLDNATLKAFSSIFIFSLITFVRSELTLLLNLQNFFIFYIIKK